MMRYDVINVIQGDCMMVRPEDGCETDDRVIMVDLGSGTRDITHCLQPNESAHIFLSNHDMAHAGGFRFFSLKGLKQVERLTIPFYQNEISLIARALLGLKGMQYAEKSSEFIIELEQLVSNQMLFAGYSHEPHSFKIDYGYQDKHFYEHIRCLNPPVCVSVRDWLREMTGNEIDSLLQELFVEDVVEAFTAYFRAKKSGKREADSKLIRELSLTIEDEDEYCEEIEYQKGNYVMDFIQENLQALRLLNMSPKRKNVLNVYERFLKVSQDVSLVLKFESEDASMLATGDASDSVFYRLLGEGEDISASYLKVPYYGSKANMSKQILRKIAPEKAIISHNNRRFGNAKDACPSMKVLEMLMEQNIEILATNDVRKGGLYTPFIHKALGNIDNIITFR